MKGRIHPSPLAALSFLIRKRYPFTVGLTEGIFKSSHGDARPRTRDLTATCCTITVRLRRLCSREDSKPNKRQYRQAFAIPTAKAQMVSSAPVTAILLLNMPNMVSTLFVKMALTNHVHSQ